jgi:thioesterase domain-containing protein
MLGDVKFHQHARVDRRVADRWREHYARDFLADLTWQLAARLGYDPATERAGAGALSSVLVRLRPGASRHPLFLVHPLSGELLLYRHLVSALGPDRAVYGFQAQGFAGAEPPLETIEAMADLYVEALLAFRPEGPYLLAGSSMGGLIAFEMARRLRARGHDAALTALLDAPAPGQAAFDSPGGDAGGEAELIILRYATGGRTTTSLAELRLLPPDERLELILRQGREAGGLGGIGPAELRRLVRVVEANRRALRAYRPEPAEVRVTYVRAAQGVKSDAVWELLAGGGMEVHEVAGSHLSMHAPPHVTALAERLGSAIARALEMEDDEPSGELALSGPGGSAAIGELGLEG